MRIIGVIDVLNGQTVAARGGLRNTYEPVRSSLCVGSEPGEVASAFVDHCHVSEVYLADLDRLGGRPANVAAWKSVSQVAASLWLDAGICDANDFATVSQQVAENTNAETATRTTLICPSESWAQPSLELDAWNCDVAKRAFSLDLRHGILNSPIERWQSLPILDVARELMDAGWSRFVVLDVAAVGKESGCPTTGLCRELRGLSDELEIVTGGGIRHRVDLRELEDAGCDAVLVSTALHLQQLP